MRKQHPDNVVLANAELIVVSGLPATQITEVARQTGADRIVMEGSNRTRLSKLIVGSVSEQVVQHSPVPVTIVHSGMTTAKQACIEAHQSEPAICQD